MRRRPLPTGAKGWRLCYDVNADGVCDAGSADDPNPIRLQVAVNSNVRLIGPASRIRFNPNGSLTASSFADFVATPGPGATPRWLVRFAASGALSVRKG
ncbi:GspH/FimT family pseudopilin [Piscinibacter sakaiensis]|uniref:GspH/FimT family pseudopilin n=1 Tax=Piscinibacter sakaiensis TaxID=1547922 RepID=UPI003AB0988A